MAETRPYYINFNGTVHMVEANSPAAAVRHVVGGDIREIRPARGSEVMAWSRAGKDIVVAGTKAVVPAAQAVVESNAGVAAEAGPGDLVPVPEFHIGHVIVIVEQGADYDPLALAAINRVKAEDRLTLEHFDVIRTPYPEFALALADIAYGTPVTLGDIDAVRARLEEQPMPAQEVADKVLTYVQGKTAVELGFVAEDPVIGAAKNDKDGEPHA